MKNTGRSVRRLHIRSQVEESLSADIITLEDAFNTASLPGLPPNGLLLIKTLELGTFQTGSTATVLSQLIDDKIRAKHYQPTCVDQSEQANENVVWFSDSTEAAFSLLNCLLDNRQPKAWYWRLLFPSIKRQMSITDGLKVICMDIPRNELKPIVLVQVMRELILRNNSSSILTIITPQLAQMMANEIGLYPLAVPVLPVDKVAGSNRCAEISSPWFEIVDIAIEYWGSDDIRCHWLVYCALLDTNPALLDSELVWPRIHEFINSMNLQTAAVDEEVVKPQKAYLDQRKNTLVEKTEKIPINDSIKSLKQKNDLGSDIDLPPMFKPRIIERASSKNGDYSIEGKRANTLNSGSLDCIQPKCFYKTKPVNTGQSFDEFIDIEYAGFGFVFSLLNLLSIKQVISDNLFLTEINFPLRLLHLLAKRMKIEGNSALLQTLPAQTEVSNATLDEFRAPSSWQSLIEPPDQSNNWLYRLVPKDKQKRCYIVDKSKRLLLYSGDNVSQLFPSWIAKYQMVELTGRYQMPSIEILDITFQLLFSRYLNRYANMSLRRLVMRPGQLTVTRSHIDFLFNLQQADIRIRKAGLDIDPGWVTWLGKVVQFHYQQKDHSDA
jgi:hypothetical protein